MARVVYNENLMQSRPLAAPPSYRDRGMETFAKQLALANEIASSPLTGLAIRGIDKGIGALAASGMAASDPSGAAQGAPPDMVGAAARRILGQSAGEATVNLSAPGTLGKPGPAAIGRDTSGETHWGVQIEPGAALGPYTSDNGIAFPAMSLANGAEANAMRSARDSAMDERNAALAQSQLVDAARRRIGMPGQEAPVAPKPSLADREAAATAEWQAIQPGVLAEVNGPDYSGAPYPKPNAATEWMANRRGTRDGQGPMLASNGAVPGATAVDAVQTAQNAPQTPAASATPASAAETVAPVTAQNKPAGGADLKSATVEQLQKARGRLDTMMRANADPAQGVDQQIALSLLDRELASRGAGRVAAAADTGPVDIDQLMVEASTANSPEKQAAVWEKAKRARAPIASLSDLFSNSPMDRLTATLRAKMPGAALTAEQVAIEHPDRVAMAGLYKERADSERDLRVPKGDKLRAEATERTARGKGVLDRIAAQNAKDLAAADDYASKAKERDALLDANRKKIEAEGAKLRELAAKAARRGTGRGGPSDFTKDDAKYVSEYNDRAARRIADVDRVLQDTQRAAEREKDIAENSGLRAEMAAAHVGDPPAADSQGFIDPKLVSDYNKRREIADAARVAADKAAARYDDAAAAQQKAIEQRQAALTLGDDDRKFADDVARYGMGGVRKGKNKPAPAPPAAGTAPVAPAATVDDDARFLRGGR